MSFRKFRALRSGRVVSLVSIASIDRSVGIPYRGSVGRDASRYVEKLVKLKDRAPIRPRRITKDYPLSDVSVARRALTRLARPLSSPTPHRFVHRGHPGRVLDSDTPTPPAGAPGGSRLQPARRQPGHAPLRPCLHAYPDTPVGGRGCQLAVSGRDSVQCPVAVRVPRSPSLIFSKLRSRESSLALHGNTASALSALSLSSLSLRSSQHQTSTLCWPGSA